MKKKSASLKVKLISKKEAWRLFKEVHRTAHEDWTPDFFLTDFLKEQKLKLK